MFRFQEASTKNNEIFYNSYSNKRKAVVFRQATKASTRIQPFFSFKTIEGAVTFSCIVRQIFSVEIVYLRVW